MTFLEALQCLIAVVSSSIGQLNFKAVTHQRTKERAFFFLCVGGGFMLLSVFLAVQVLRTVDLSKLVPFAALAYVLTPLGAVLIFKEKLFARFWGGAALIALGIVMTLL